MDWLLTALGATDFMPHSMCLTNDPLMIGLYAAHDFMIFISYTIIASLMLASRGAPAGPGYIGFSAFIFLCGATHLTDVLVLKWGIYRLDIVVRVATAWISASVAAYVVRDYLQWRSPQAN